MTNLNYLGTFASIAALWEALPEGGNEGDFALIGSTYYGWDKYARQWVETEAPSETPEEPEQQEEEETTAPAAESTGFEDANNLGEFETLEAVWEAVPEGGQIGDTVTIDGTLYRWDATVRNWSAGEAQSATPLAMTPLGAANSTDINYLGTFASIDDVWIFYPEGGHEGDYVVVDATVYSWNTLQRAWTLSENTIITIEYLSATPSTSTRINYIGAFTDLESVWEAFPEGGYEGDYVHIDGYIRLWNKSVRNWSENDNPGTPAIEGQEVEGDLTVTHNLYVGGKVSGNELEIDNPPYYEKDEVDEKIGDAIDDLKDLKLKVDSQTVGTYNPKQATTLKITREQLRQAAGIPDWALNPTAPDTDHAHNADQWDGHEFDDYMDQPVRTTDDVTFAKVTTPRVESPQFSEGALGAGFRLWITQQGHAELEVDDITVRRTMKVFEMIIQQLKHQGGMYIYSAAALECTSVTEISTGYICYFDTKDGQIPNEFVVGDQARCQRFNLGTTELKYYWRLVTAVGDDYIVLSKEDCDAGSGVPEAGDNIIQLGNRTNTARQAAKVTTTIDNSSPRDDYYKGINSYDLTGKLVTTVGVKDGEVGVWTENGEFKGRVTITGGGGLNSLAEWNDMSYNVSSAWAEALAASAAAGAAQGTANQAILDAATADAAADAAQAAADALGTKLNNWASDSYISPVEKEALRQQKADVMKEYTEMISRANRYSVSTTAFTAAYALAAAALTKYTAASPELIEIDDDYDDIAAYYDARADLLVSVAAAEKAATDAAQGTANQAVLDAAAAQGTANLAKTKAEALEAILEAINDDTVLDLVEKNVIRTQWVTINGTEDLGRTGSKGSYLATKALAALYGNVGAREVITYNSVEVTYGGEHIYYNVTGTAALDMAYIALREFLRGVGLNDREHVFENFDRKLFANLLTDYGDAEIRVADNVNRSLALAMTAFQDAVQANIDEMQGQLDNTIDYWFASGVPTTSNYPASNWNTAALKKDHIGDVYYDEDSGKGYRWQVNASNVYYWNLMQDDAATRALALAQQAKDTADGKRRVFLAQPGTGDSYDVGDVWMHATIGSYNDEMLVAQTAKAAGTAFSVAHWRTATKYTDDTVANEAKQAATNAQTLANTANNTADAAAAAAATAQTTANAAKTQLQNWASDQYISPVEKEALRQQKADVTSEHTAMVGEATSYGISVTAFNTAYNAAIAAFDKYTSTSTENIAIESDYADIAAYFTARAAIAASIAQKAKEGADAAQQAADAAAGAAELAGTAAADAMAAAETVAAAVAGIDLDTKLDEAEKANIRVIWTGINGIPSTGSAGRGGTYHAAKVTLTEEGRVGLKTEITYKNVTVTYNGEHIYYNVLGEARLDAAYLALREYLNGCQINAPGEFNGFDRDKYAELVRDYDVALDQVFQILSDVAKQAADAAQAKADAASLEAQAAQTAANNAQTKANQAYNKAGDVETAVGIVASDGWITPAEKVTLKRQLDDINAEHTAFVQEAGKYSINVDAFNSAKNGATSVLSYYTAAATWNNNTQVSNSYPLSNITAYFNARATLAQSIATAAKAAVVQAQEDADSANEGIRTINDILTNFTADDYISPMEKRTLKQALDDEVGNHGAIAAQAGQFLTQAAINTIGNATLTNTLQSLLNTCNAKYSTSSGNNAFRNVILYYTQDTANPNHSTTWAWEDTVPVSNSYPLTAIPDYYTARDNLVDQINICAKTYAEKFARNYTDAEIQSNLQTARQELIGLINTGDGEALAAASAAAAAAAVADTKAGNAATAAANAQSTASGAASAAAQVASDAIMKVELFGTTTITGGHIKSEFINVTALAADAGFINALTVNKLRTNSGKVVIEADGSITATDVNLTGTITATSGRFEGTLISNSGSIGGFTISNGYIGTERTAQSPDGAGMSLYNDFIFFRDYDTGYYHAAFYEAAIGANTLSAVYGYRSLTRFVADGSEGISNIDTGKAIGVLSSIKGFADNWAWYCPEGIFVGFRPRIAIHSNGKSLDQYDTVILCENNVAVGFYLPSEPKEGQFYAIIHATRTTLNVYGSTTHPILRVTNGNAGTSVVASADSGSMETILLAYIAKGSVTYNGASRKGFWTLTYLKVS